MGKHLLTASLVIVGVIHLLPLSGVLGVERLDALYGITIDDPNVTILMRHRAVLFGLLGAFLVYAAFKPPLQLIALAAGAASVLSFIVLAMLTGDYNEAIRRVFVADVVAAVFLLLGFAAYLASGSGD